MRIVALEAQHAEAVLAIYREGIEDGDATFETAAPEWADFDAGRLALHRYAAVDDVGDSETRGAGAHVLGWVAVSSVSQRPAYAGVVEHSVYVRRSDRGRGVGTALLTAMIASTESAGIWTIQSGIFPENAASLSLHRALGFREVGLRRRIARQHGTWRDVLLIERRSRLIE